MIIRVTSVEWTWLELQCASMLPCTWVIKFHQYLCALSCILAISGSNFCNHNMMMLH